MSQEETNLNLSQVLLDVRKAYRLVAAFQERLVSYVATIKERLGFQAYHGETWFAPGKRDVYWKLPRDHRGWEYLPFALMTYLFLRQVRKRDEYLNSDYIHNQFPGDMMLVVQVLPDTSLAYDSLSSLKPPDSSRSAIWIWILLNGVERQTGTTNWYHRIYRQLDVDDWKFISKPIESEADSGIAIYGQEWNLEDLPDEESLLSKVDTFADAVMEELQTDLRQPPPEG